MASSLVPGKKPRIDLQFAHFKLAIRKSKIHRVGIFAAEDIPAHRKIIEYTGERINRKETLRRSNQQHKLIYLFTLDKYWTIDGATGGSGAEYINHSCDPNVRAWITKGHILYMSMRAIRNREELTVDYHFAKNIERVPCFCGATSCRGTINVK